jgi:hypothetical protein
MVKHEWHIGKKAVDKTMICSCKSVRNDVYGWDKGTNSSFTNTKNGAGSCFCEINNNKTGKRSKKIKIYDVVLTQDKRKSQ